MPFTLPPPLAQPDPQDPLDALLHRAAFAPIPTTGWLRITGPDRVRWLNGMTTNAIQSLAPGHGCYTFFLNPQGRIQADAYAYLIADSILLQTANPTTLAELLDRFIIMDDVELEVLGQSRTGLLLAGPQAPTLLTTLELPVPPTLTLTSTTWQTTSLDLLQTHSPLVPTFELWSDPATIGLLTETLRHLTATAASPESLTQLRILSGTPLYATDIRDKDLPQETNQTRALNFSKGCYIGQEIVERIHARGAVHRTFTGFLLTGETPTPNTPITANDKSVGELTSITTIANQTIALGYIRREALNQTAQTVLKTLITYPNGIAAPTSLPFL